MRLTVAVVVGYLSRQLLLGVFVVAMLTMVPDVPGESRPAVLDGESNFAEAVWAAIQALGTLVGGAVAAAIARDRRVLASFLVGVLSAVEMLLTVFEQAGPGAVWPSAIIAVLMIPVAVLGGRPWFARKRAVTG